MAHTSDSSIIMRNSIFAWLALATGIILLVPLLMMQVSSEMQWTLSDFVVLGVLVFGIGSLWVLVARKLPTPSHRIVLGILCALLLVYLWAELAVGIFTNLGS